MCVCHMSIPDQKLVIGLAVGEVLGALDQSQSSSHGIWTRVGDTLGGNLKVPVKGPTFSIATLGIRSVL